MGVMKRKSLMIIEFSDHMFIHLVQIHFGPLNCCFYVKKKFKTLTQCVMNVYFSHINLKKKSLQQNTDFISYFGRRWEVRKVINSWCVLCSAQYAQCELCSAPSKSQNFCSVEISRSLAFTKLCLFQARIKYDPSRCSSNMRNQG